MKQPLRRSALALAMAMSLAGSARAATPLSYHYGDAHDPGVQAAQFTIEDQRYLDTTIDLLALQAEHQTAPMSPTFERRLALASLNYGVPDWARVYYRELIVTSNHTKQLAQQWMLLALFDYQRGRPQAAWKELQALKPHIPGSMQLQWEDLASRVQLALKHYSQAISILTEGGDAGSQTPYMRYNLAVAYLRSGQTSKGLGLLDDVGQITPTDSDTLALRDKANLVLAYRFLQHHHPAQAIPLFERVRLKGLYSNRALLGLGWAVLAQSGALQPSGKTGTSTNAGAQDSTLGAIFHPGFLDHLLGGGHDFRLGDVPKNKRAALEQALVPWSLLLARDPMDPAVQECMMALPYVLDQLGAHSEARKRYEIAVKTLEQSRKRIAAAIGHVDSNRMIDTMVFHAPERQSGWRWRLTELPDAPETFYLQALIAEHPFQESLKNYRDLRQLLARLEQYQTRLARIQNQFGHTPSEKVPMKAVFEQAIARSPNNAHPKPVHPPRLLMSTKLRPPNQPGDDIPMPKPNLPPLRLGAAPTHFYGPWEQIASVQKRIGALLPDLKQAIAEQAGLLQNIADTDLKAQDALAKKYLVQARFALARLYDRSPNDAEPVQ